MFPGQDSVPDFRWSSSFKKAFLGSCSVPGFKQSFRFQAEVQVSGYVSVFRSRNLGLNIDIYVSCKIDWF